MELLQEKNLVFRKNCLQELGKHIITKIKKLLWGNHFRKVYL